MTQPRALANPAGALVCSDTCDSRSVTCFWLPCAQHTHPRCIYTHTGKNSKQNKTIFKKRKKKEKGLVGVKNLATKPDDLSLILRTCTVE